MRQTKNERIARKRLSTNKIQEKNPEHNYPTEVHLTNDPPDVKPNTYTIV
jgi:hypothetical protein